MNNLTWSSGESSKKTIPVKIEPKPKKKISFKKDIEDLQKLNERLKEKYDSVAINRISNAIMEIETAIRNLKSLEYYESK